MSLFVHQLRSRFDEQRLQTVGGPDLLRLNDIGEFTVQLADPLPVDSYDDNRRTGACVLIDSTDGGTPAAGVIDAGLPTVDVLGAAEASRDV